MNYFYVLFCDCIAQGDYTRLERDLRVQFRFAIKLRLHAEFFAKIKPSHFRVFRQFARERRNGKSDRRP